MPITATHAAVSAATAHHAAERALQPAAAGELPSQQQSTSGASAAEAAAAAVAAVAVTLAGGIASVSAAEAADALEGVIAAAHVPMTAHELAMRWRANLPAELDPADSRADDADLFADQVRSLIYLIMLPEYRQHPQPRASAGLA